MLRADAYTASFFQHGYDLAWDGYAMPIGTFRMLIAVAPAIIDAIHEFWVGGLQSIALGTALYIVALCLLYDPFVMARDNRLQARGSYASLNHTSQDFARRTRFLRLFYMAIFILALVLFHRIGGLLLVDIAYARCIKIRPRLPRAAVRRRTARSFDVVLWR